MGRSGGTIAAAELTNRTPKQPDRRKYWHLQSESRQACTVDPALSVRTCLVRVDLPVIPEGAFTEEIKDPGRLLKPEKNKILPGSGSTLVGRQAEWAAVGARGRHFNLGGRSD